MSKPLLLRGPELRLRRLLKVLLQSQKLAALTVLTHLAAEVDAGEAEPEQEADEEEEDEDEDECNLNAAEGDV